LNYTQTLRSNIHRLGSFIAIHSQLNKNQFHAAYHDIIQNKKTIVIGTKLALFTPLKPTLIIFDQAENQNHKQADQNPRFDARTVAGKLAEYHQGRILYSSYAPSADLYQLVEEKKVLLLQPESAKKTVQVVDLKNERLKKNYSLFSDDLEESINETLNAGQKVFLFLNKKGAASSVICKDCGLVLDCHKCARPLVHHQTSNFLYCHYCNTRNEVPPFCPKCSSVDFKFVGAGTQTVEQQAKKIWPQAKIIRLDKDSALNRLPKGYDLVIGTEYALDLLDWPAIGLCGIISADTFLHLPDFRAAERTWQILKKITFFHQGKIILHTYNPEGLPIRFFPDEEKKFYQQELVDRQLMSYPPFTSLVKLIYQHADKNICLANTQKYLKVLKTSPLQSMILTPLAPRQNNRYRMYIVIKFKSPLQDSLLKKVLSSIPDGWIIDRDPINLL
jgi:primosomal protein N' (replication factor Y)